MRTFSSTGMASTRKSTGSRSRAPSTVQCTKSNQPGFARDWYRIGVRVHPRISTRVRRVGSSPRRRSLVTENGDGRVAEPDCVDGKVGERVPAPRMQPQLHRLAIADFAIGHQHGSGVLHLFDVGAVDDAGLPVAPSHQTVRQVRMLLSRGSFCHEKKPKCWLLCATQSSTAHRLGLMLADDRQEYPEVCTSVKFDTPTATQSTARFAVPDRGRSWTADTRPVHGRVSSSGRF